MAKYLLALALLIVTPWSKASAQQVLRVVLKSGEVVQYPLEDVDHLLLDGIESPAEGDTIPGLGGTCAEPVDMGLSVRWASHNLGASVQSGCGVHTSWNQCVEQLALWGSEWHLPTALEWTELMEKCRWTWEMCNGVAGRRVTGPSGNSIFLPFVGYELTDGLYTVGAVGAYWTATPHERFEESSLGIYMDSGNLYEVEFARTTGLSVRPVCSK